MVIRRRKPVNPDPGIKVKIAGFGQDNHAAFPIRLVEPITVHHVIERKPIPRPDYIEIRMYREDGSYITNQMNVGHFYESPSIHIHDGITEVRLIYFFGSGR